MKAKAIYSILIPGFVIFYIGVIVAQYHIKNSDEEIFPFFSWSLFSGAPLGDASFSFVELNGNTYAAHNHPSSTNFSKAILKSFKICQQVASDVCNKSSEQILSPYLKRLAKDTVTYTLGVCMLDMYEARDRLLAAERRMPSYSKQDCISTEEFGPWEVKL